MTVDCPLDCVYLSQAHEFEKPQPVASLPHQEIEISPEFIEEHERLLTMLSATILMAAAEIASVIDADVREALAALSETYITLDKGVLYEHLPQNPVAAQIYRRVQQAIDEIRQAEDSATRRTRDSDLMRMLIFLERVAVDRDNGRKRCKAFLGMLQRLHEREIAPDAPSSTLILP